MTKKNNKTHNTKPQEEIEQLLREIDLLLQHVIFRIREMDGRIGRTNKNHRRQKKRL